MRYLTVLTMTVFVCGNSAILGQPKDKLADIVKIEFPKDGYAFTLDEAAKGVKAAHEIRTLLESRD